MRILFGVPMEERAVRAASVVRETAAAMREEAMTTARLLEAIAAAQRSMCAVADTWVSPLRPIEHNQSHEHNQSQLTHVEANAGQIAVDGGTTTAPPIAAQQRISRPRNE